MTSPALMIASGAALTGGGREQEWLIGEPYRHFHVVREGELCGPGYRWTYQPKYADSDLSCEPE